MSHAYVAAGHTDIGYHNELADGLLRTPHLDALAGGGVKLEGYYVQPARTQPRTPPSEQRSRCGCCVKRFRRAVHTGRAR